MGMRSHLLLATLLGTSFSVTTFANEGDLDRYLAGLVSKKSVPSASLAIVKNGKVIYAKAFGKSDLENEVSATPTTVYRLGSITKQFTATMIMQLVSEGKLKVDQPVRELLTDLPTAWSKVTVRNLLNHTSGIKSYTEVKGIFADAALKPTTPAGILKTVESEPLQFEPGSRWHYNNSGYEVLGMVIEKLDARKYAESLKARILRPLGMNQTYFTSEQDLVPHRAHGYSPTIGGFRNAPYLNMDWPYAAGSMESTTLDLAKWDAALYGEKVLSKPLLTQMWTKTVLTNGKTENYGFGWQLESIKGQPTVEHGGGIHGFATYIKRVPTSSLTIILLVNDDGADSNKIASEALGAYDPSFREAPDKTIKDSDTAATAAAKVMVQSMLDGKLDRTKLTKKFNELVTPELEKGAQSQLSAMGKITGFVLTDSQKLPEGISRSYVVTIGTKTLHLTVVQDSKGLVDALVLKP